MFFDKVSSDNSLIRKPSHKYISSSVKELSNITAAVRRIEPAKIGMGNNLSQLEEVALRELKELTRTEIEVKKADKTNTLVIMDKADYRDQLVHQCHLATNSYEPTEENIDKRVHNKIKKFCNKFDGCLTKSEKDAIIDDDWATSNFYVLPKINKSATVVSEISKAQKECVEMNMPTDLKSRPIVSGPKSVTRGISKLLEKILTPLVTTLRSFIKDERDFLRKFPKNINKDSRIVCCDVVSLYTSIPNELGLKAIEFWIGKLRHLIPNRFSKDFILEGVSFVLENNNFNFDGKIWRQRIGTAMGKEVASPYACLTVGYLEETILFPTVIPSRFDSETAEEIIENFYRFVDDGVSPLPLTVPGDTYLDALNSMDSSIQYTIAEPTEEVINERCVNSNVFLSLQVYTTEDGEVLTNIFYKETNNHDYLSYDSHHPSHVKDNIPYVLAKNIIVATSENVIMEQNLADLKKWLQNCKYPIDVINRGVFNARLQGPANAPERKPTIPFISTYFSNIESSNILETAKSLLQNSTNQRIKDVFNDVQFIHARRQPPNLLRQITNASFIQGERERNPGIHLCSRPNCKICRLYLQECSKFTTANGTEWVIKSEITCHSKNTLYYLLCSFCGTVSKLGKTDDLRERTNNHISAMRYGKSSDKFDRHVYRCSQNKNVPHNEPFFKLFAFMTVSDYTKLRNHERRLYLGGHDNINTQNSDDI